MPFTILIVDDEAKARGSMGRLLSAAGYEILEAESLARAVATCRTTCRTSSFWISTCLNGHGLDLLRKLSGTKPRPQVVVVTGTANIPTAVEALQLGAADLLEKPVDMARLKAVVQRATEVVRLQRELDYYQQSARAEAVDWVMGETPRCSRCCARRDAPPPLPCRCSLRDKPEPARTCSPARST